MVYISLLFIFFMPFLLLMKASFTFLHAHANRLMSWWWSLRKKITKLHIYRAHVFPKVWKRFYSPTSKRSRNLNILRTAVFTILFSNKYWVSLLLWTTSPNCFLGHCVEKDSEVTYSMFSSSHPLVPISGPRDHSSIPILSQHRCSSASFILQDVSSQNIF